MRYQVEQISTCIDEIKPLFLKHWQEIAGNQDSVPLAPDFDRYYRLETEGMLRIYTARSGYDDTLIGYFISFVLPHIHYSTTMYAFNDVLYLSEEHRGGTVGYRLIRGAMKDLKDNCNVDILVVHMKIKHEFRRLLTSLGFTCTEENWEVKL